MKAILTRFVLGTTALLTTVRLLAAAQKWCRR
jgi:hypothetical protein